MRPGKWTRKLRCVISVFAFPGMAIENEVMKLDKYNFRYVTKKEAKNNSVLVMFYNSS